MAAVELRTVTKLFGDVAALDGVDLEAAEGEVVAVLGPSGAGKSTVLGLVAGFDTPSSGTVLLDGRDVTGVPAHRRDVGLVLQSYALFPHLTVAENVAFPLRVRRMRAAPRSSAAAAALDLVGLGSLGARHPHELSGGQQQRVALARAIVFEPRVLLLDEPLAALDRRLRQQMQGELRALQRRLGTTTVIVTHDQEEALTMADRVVVLRDGRVAQCGTPQDLYRRPADHFVATFLGEGNLLDGIISRNGRGPTLDLGPHGTVHLDPAGVPAAGAPAVLLVRPELVHVTARGDGGGEGLASTVTDVVFAGAQTTYRLRSDSGLTLTATVPAEVASHAVGALVDARWKPEHAHVLPTPAPGGDLP